jgi:drug/metabolite transporter (DMT)-like permease
MRGVDVIGPNSSGLYANLVPIFSTILSVLLLNEALQSFHLVSLVMVFFGIYIFEIKAQRKNID